MKRMQGYMAGVNLGGWLSQYREYSYEHFDTFITEQDIKRISSWGMDHVRLPVDYPLLEDDDAPFNYKEEGFKYVDKCVQWCKNHGLNVILDLHRAPGFSFSTPDKNRLFDDPLLQERFVKLWQYFAKRYVNERDNVAFELLNEVVEPDSKRWNVLSHRAMRAIREIDLDRIIIIGGNRYNSVFTLKELEIIDDPNVVYTFHYYEPMLFTHQKASWVDVCAEFNQGQEYPGRFVGLKEFLRKRPEYKGWESQVDVVNDRGLMEKNLKVAEDFMRSTGKELYCGEYGVISDAPLQSRINWHRDFVDLARELNIGRACWSYKEMNFGLVDADGCVISDELIEVVSKK